MKGKKEKWEPCPRCGSKKVKGMSLLFFILLGLGTLSFGAIFMLFWPTLGIMLLVVGALFLLISPFSRNILQCEDCSKSWNFPYKEKAKKPNPTS